MVPATTTTSTTTTTTTTTTEIIADPMSSACWRIVAADTVTRAFCLNDIEFWSDSNCDGTLLNTDGMAFSSGSWVTRYPRQAFDKGNTNPWCSNDGDHNPDTSFIGMTWNSPVSVKCVRVRGDGTHPPPGWYSNHVKVQSCGDGGNTVGAVNQAADITDHHDLWHTITLSHANGAGARRPITPHATSRCWRIVNADTVTSAFCLQDIEFWSGSSCDGDQLSTKGVPFASDSWPSRNPFQAFDTNNNWPWCSANNVHNPGTSYIGMRWEHPVAVRCVRIRGESNHPPPAWYSNDVKVQSCGNEHNAEFDQRVDITGHQKIWHTITLAV